MAATHHRSGEGERIGDCMNKYSCKVYFEMSKTVEVEAENESDAASKACEIVNDEPPEVGDSVDDSVNCDPLTDVQKL